MGKYSKLRRYATANNINKEITTYNKIVTQLSKTKYYKKIVPEIQNRDTRNFLFYSIIIILNSCMHKRDIVRYIMCI